jgi:hypothetical protein
MDKACGRGYPFDYRYRIHKNALTHFSPSLPNVLSNRPSDEVRMINHFHRIGPVPNVKFVTSYIAELPHILVVVVRPIAIGAEVLIDYG